MGFSDFYGSRGGEKADRKIPVSNCYDNYLLTFILMYKLCIVAKAQVHFGSFTAHPDSLHKLEVLS